MQCVRQITTQFSSQARPNINTKCALHIIYYNDHFALFLQKTTSSIILMVVNAVSRNASIQRSDVSSKTKENVPSSHNTKRQDH